MLVAVSTYAIIKALRDKKRFSMWWSIPLLLAIVILSFKGMPMWYLLPASGALYLSTRLEMNQIHIMLLLRLLFNYS